MASVSVNTRFLHTQKNRLSKYTDNEMMIVMKLVMMICQQHQQPSTHSPCNRHRSLPSLTAPHQCIHNTLSVFIRASLSVCLSVCLPVCLIASLSHSLSHSDSLCLCLCLSVSVCVCVSVSVSVSLYVCLDVTRSFIRAIHSTTHPIT